MASRVKVMIEVSLKKEMVPGMFFNPEEFVDAIVRDINYRLMAYNPEVLSSLVEDSPVRAVYNDQSCEIVEFIGDNCRVRFDKYESAVVPRSELKIVS